MILVLAALAAYSNSFSGPFILDDPANVVDNVKIRRLWPVWETMRAPLEAVGMAGRPIAQLSLAINYAIHGPGVDGYHAGSLLLHMATALVLFGVVRRTLLTPALSPRFGTHAGPLAFAVALVWEVHPLLCDSVSYISARTEVLAGLFLLSTLYCAIRATSAGSSRGGRMWRAAAIVFCALGTGSKEVMVAAPIVVLAWDWLISRAPITAGQRPAWASTQDATENAKDVAPRLGVVFYLALFATLALIPLNLSMANFHRSAFAKVHDPMGSFDYLKVQSQVIVRYLRLSLWPDPLLVDYGNWWDRHPSLVSVLPHAAVVVALLAITIVLVVRRKPAAMLGVWFFAILAPTSSLLPLPTEIAAERRMYLPLIAIVALAVLAGYVLLQRFARERWKLLGIGLLVAVAGVEVSRTLQRNQEFKDPVALWADVLVRQPNNRRAYANLAKELLTRGQDTAAAAVYRKMIEVDPNDPATWNDLATISMHAGDWAEAERCLRVALTAKPQFAIAHQNLGLVYLKTNRFGDAEREVREAIRLDGERADRSALLAEIQNARTSTPAGAAPSP